MTKNTLDTIAGLMRCTVAEFKPQEYKGLRSGIGKERKSSKHHKCHKPCCKKTVTKSPHQSASLLDAVMADLQKLK